MLLLPLEVVMRLRLAVALFVCASCAIAQSAGGLAGISGVVRDPSGSLVPNAKVVISNETNGTARSLTTNEAGLFTAPALVPAPGYKVSVTAAGFAGYDIKDIVMQVVQNIDLAVKIS